MRFPGSGILNGFRITMRNMLRRPITVRYPEERLELPPRARWAVRHKRNEDGSPKCTACLICVKECPDHIIHLESSPKEGGGKHIDRYWYEMGACMMCGLCVESCPFDAIEMSHEYELATSDKTCITRILLADVDAASPKRAPRVDTPATPARERDKEADDA